MAVSTLLDGTDDRIVTTGNDITLTGAWTFGALVHPEGMAAIDTISGGRDAGTERWTLYLNGLAFNHVAIAGSNITGPTLATPNAAGWYYVWITRPAGAAQTCRWHIFDGRVWNHVNGGGTAGNTSGVISAINLGTFDVGTPGDFFDGDIALHGIWSEDTVDATIETYTDYLNVLAKGNRQFLTGLSLLNGGTLDDISTNNNDEASRVGATTGVRDLPGWMRNFQNDGNFPRIVSWAAANGTTGNPTLTNPTGASPGDLVIWAVAHDSGDAMSGSTGWAELHDTANGTAVRAATYAKVLTGTNDTLTVTFGSANDYACAGMLIRGHGVTAGAESTGITIGTAATGSDAAPNPPNCNPGTARDHLWIAWAASDDDDNANAFMPANFAGLAQVEGAQSTTTCMMSVAYRMTNAASLDPGTFTLAAIEEWVTQTLAIPPGPIIPVRRMTSQTNPAALWKRAHLI